MNNFPVPTTATEINLLDSLACAVIAIDDAMRIRYINSSAEQLLGVSALKLINLRLTHALTIPDALFARIRQSLESGQPFTDRQVSVEPHGQDPQIVDLSFSPYRIDSHCIGLVMEVMTVDRPLRIARDEAMLAQQEHFRSLLRGLAHEIKNPLGGLRGAAQLLDRQLHDEELSEYTHIIIREADRLQGLIDRMLGPTSRPRRDVINLHEILEHVRKIIIAGAPERVHLTYDYDPSIPECLTDRDRLVQVLLNIAGNALEAVASAGNIVFRSRILHNFTISGKRHRLTACLQIIDDGPGIPEGLIDQIFFPMVTGTAHGTGLGLSIAQSTMNQLGGLIECSSEPGNTVFTVLIPLEVA